MRLGDRNSTKLAEVDETAGNEDRLIEVDERIMELRRRRAELDRDVERWKQERNRINIGVMELRAEGFKHKEKRNIANKSVSEIKNRIELLRKELTEKRRRLAETEAELKKNREKLIPRRKAEDRLKHIEWEIMTTPTADIMEKERGLLEEARILGNNIAAHRKLETREDDMLKELANIKAIELKIQNSLNEVSTLRESSSENHEKMIFHYKKADEEQKKADDAHSNFLEKLSAIRVIDEELNSAIKESRRLRELFRESEFQVMVEREHEIESRKKELITEARRKLDAGKKLSLNELKLIYQEKEDDKK